MASALSPPFGAGRSRKHHIGLQEHPLQRHPLSVHVTWLHPLQSMRAVHEHIRLDDGDQSSFLARCGIASQCLRVKLNAAPVGKPNSDRNDGTPLANQAPM